jgi:hypothetical protein
VLGKHRNTLSVHGKTLKTLSAESGQESQHNELLWLKLLVRENEERQMIAAKYLQTDARNDMDHSMT